MPSAISVKELIDNGMTEVPPMFIRAPEDRPFLQDDDDQSSSVTFHGLASPDDAYNHGSTCQPGLISEEEIPVIDLSDLISLTGTDASHQSSAKGKVLEKIGRACEDYGFFQVINHGVEPHVIHNIRKAALHFFDQASEERRRIGGTFYEGSVNPQFERVHDWMERLVFRRLSAGESDIDGFKTAPHFLRAQLLEYLDSVERLANVVYGAIFDSLGLESDCNISLPKMQRIVLAINYYPPCPNPSVVMGISPHSDQGCITILHQDSVPGLQVRNGEKWIHVKSSHPDAFIVNIADQTEILTNGKYKSIEHRVFTNSKHARMSIPCFFAPTHDTIIAPLHDLVDQNNPPRFKPTLFGDYDKNFFSKALQANKGNLDFARV